MSTDVDVSSLTAADYNGIITITTDIPGDSSELSIDFLISLQTPVYTGPSDNPIQYSVESSITSIHTESVVVQNEGDAILTATLSLPNNPTWLSITSAGSANINPGGLFSFEISFDPTGLSLGERIIYTLITLIALITLITLITQLMPI